LKILKGITLACYELENTEKQEPEKLTIDLIISLEQIYEVFFLIVSFV
jgi:hypothetical protein